MASSVGNVARILYKQLVDGDIRKIEAQSNDATTGGGARDFRFGSYNQLRPAIMLMFPDTVQESRRRGGSLVNTNVHKGVFCWLGENGNVVKKDAFFEPPNDARPSEGRIRRVHEYPCLDASHLRLTHDDRVLLLLIQAEDGGVWPSYAEESSLRTPGLWHADVASELVKCIDATRPTKDVVIGFRDFTTNARYCNGK